MLVTNELGTTLARSRIVRNVFYLAGIILGTLNATANAAQRNQGAMDKGPVAFIVVTAIGLSIVGFGIYAVWLGVMEQTEKEKAKFRRDSMAAFGYIKPPIPIYKSAIAVAIGVAILLAGIVFLAFVPAKVRTQPAASLARTESTETRRNLRSEAPSNSVIPEPEFEEPVEPAPPAEVIETQPRLIPSRRKAVEEKPRRGARNPMVTESTASPKPQPSIDRKRPESTARLAPVTRYKIEIPLPDGAMVVTPETSLSPGMKLGAVWARKWNEVTVERVHDDGTVDVAWDGWRTKYRMMREDLAIDKKVALGPETLDSGTLGSETQGAGTSANAGTENDERLWKDVSGNFSIVATYLDSQSGYVLLRKSDGTEISIPIVKLSKPDRD
ncbi:SHD1 domain-containing protein [Neorhodopirellula lusitana]|uniref:SHD1 domain-containing protein n=1 Tax=Neorhodopirellula lusitana TaxID=445327 RepID=UPI00384BB833